MTARRRGYVPPPPRDFALRCLLDGIDQVRDALGAVSVDQVRQLMQAVDITPPTERPRRPQRQRPRFYQRSA